MNDAVADVHEEFNVIDEAKESAFHFDT